MEGLSIEKRQALARAKEYPYARPNTSFLFVTGNVSGRASDGASDGDSDREGEIERRTFRFQNHQWKGLAGLHTIDGLEVDGNGGVRTSAQFAKGHGVDLPPLASAEHYRWPVLAIGSNAAPAQLARKFRGLPRCVVPVIQCTLKEYDVVYAPSLTGYGSCPASLAHSPGTSVTIFITFLTDELKEDMDASEGVALRQGGYHLQQLSGLIDRRLTHEDFVYAYIHKSGSFHLPIIGWQGMPIAIADIPAEGRTFRALSQTRMLAELRARLGEDDDEEGQLPQLLWPQPGDDVAALNAWILGIINDSGRRSVFVERLKLHSFLPVHAANMRLALHP